MGGGFFLDNNSVNYLGHPSLYYHIMRMANAISDTSLGSVYYIDIFNNKYINIAIVGVALLLVFYIGYTRIGKNRISPHILYVIINISIPMLAFVASGVNNDNLAYLALVLFFFGVLRFYENKQDIKTFALVNTSVALGFLSKLTVGVIMTLVIIGILVEQYVKLRSLASIFNKKFWLTAPIYIFPLIFYVYILFDYHTMQVTLKTLDYEYFKTSFFYLPENQRRQLTVFEFCKEYFRTLLLTWSTIYSNETLVKPLLSLQALPFELIFLGYVISAFLIATKKKERDAVWLFAFMLSIFVTLCIQFVRSYKNFLADGAITGCQARYYLPCLPVISYTCAKCYEKYCTNRRKIVEYSMSVVCYGFCAWMIYADIVYFYLYYRF